MKNCSREKKMQPDLLCNSNRRFWSELCGSHMAQIMGIDPCSPDSLQRFDDSYLKYYDYILPKITPYIATGTRVLEVGLGYGTIGQQLAAMNCDYQGMDIAEGPVMMMRSRLGFQCLKGTTLQDNFLENSFADSSVDLFVSIGCLHHTGSLKKSTDEVHRILKPGGTAVIMVYNRFSYRQWYDTPMKTLRAALKESFTSGFDVEKETGNYAGTYDTNSKGQEAPYTEFSSIRRIRSLFRNFTSVKIEKENCADEVFFGKTFFRDNVRPILGKWCGLDLYITAAK